MICPPCAGKADAIAAYNRQHQAVLAFPRIHDPAICRDNGRAGCPCGHGQTHPAPDQPGRS